jgi:hypothetical protein
MTSVIYGGVMESVQFTTKIKNGKIEIPEAYRGRFGDRVRVILLSADQRSGVSTAIDELIENPLKVPGFKPLSREEAHERS